jgi:CP family cyanate transporter-like MFS transporter
VLVAPSQLAVVWAVLLGIGTGGTFSVTLLLMASRARDAVIAARLSGMAQGIGYMISAMGPLTAGLLHSVSGGWQLPLVVTIGICGAQLAAGIGASRPGVVTR